MKKVGGSSILAAMFNAVFLVMVAGGLSWEAIQRFSEPKPIAGMTVRIVAACGIAVNGISVWVFAAGIKGDLNVRGAFLHMMADALVSLGVVIAGVLILVTGWLWLDPLMSLVINAVIIYGTWSLLKGSITMSLQAVPLGIDLAKRRSFLIGLPGVTGVHDFPVRSLSTTDTAMTCHLVMPNHKCDDSFTAGVAHDVNELFRIGHTTLQVEKSASKSHPSSVHTY